MLESLTRPNYPRAALGLSDRSVTALSLQRESAGRYGIRQASTIDLPEGVLAPSFTEQNILQPSRFEGLLDRAATDCGLGGQRRWSVSLPSNAARTAILTLSEVPASKRELEEILDFKAETSFGVPSSELRISIEKIRPSTEGKARYFATAVSLGVIDEYESIFEGLGWRAGLILPRSVCEVKWLSNGRSLGDALLISGQENGFTAMLMRDGDPALVRSVNCGREEVDDEIYRLLVYYNDKYGGSGSGLSRFLVVGDGELDVRLKTITAEALGTSVEPLRPEDIGLYIPSGSVTLADVAAPAGAASFGIN